MIGKVSSLRQVPSVISTVRNGQPAAPSSGWYMPVTASPRFHLPVRRNTPSGKPDFPESGMINAVEYLHQRIAVRPWLHVIEQIQLRDAVRTEIIEHYPRFCVAVAIEPDLCPET